MLTEKQQLKLEISYRKIRLFSLSMIYCMLVMAEWHIIDIFN